MTQQPNDPTTEHVPKNRDWIAYVLPMAIFMVITALIEPAFVKYFPAVYATKVILVTASLFLTARFWKQDVKIEGKWILPGAIVGIAIIVLWFALDPFTPQLSILGKRTEYNPFKEIESAMGRNVFMAFRFFGLVVTVPIMEEIFWRSFLIRYITKENFREVPIGTFSAGAFAFVAVGFALAHPEWLAALVCAALLAGLLKWSKSLWACIIAHAVANLALGIYVLQTGQWKFW